jgi:hypothetical protein
MEFPVENHVKRPTSNMTGTPDRISRTWRVGQSTGEYGKTHP